MYRPKELHLSLWVYESLRPYGSHILYLELVSGIGIPDSCLDPVWKVDLSGRRRYEAKL